MSRCFHEIRFYHDCAHTEDCIRHAAYCPAGVPSTSSSSELVVDFIKPLDKREPQCLGKSRDWRYCKTNCGLCSAATGETLQPMGHFDQNKILHRRNHWKSVCDRYTRFLTERFGADAREVDVTDVLTDPAERQRKAQLASQERIAIRKSRWFAGLALYRNSEIAYGVPINKRRYFFDAKDNLTTLGNLFEKVDPASIPEDELCAICLEPLRDPEITAANLPCGHTYHLEDSCISGWMEDHSNCPYCRVEFSRIFLLPDFNDPIYHVHRNSSLLQVITGYNPDRYDLRPGSLAEEDDSSDFEDESDFEDGFADDDEDDENDSEENGEDGEDG